MKLTIELVPEGGWFRNLRSMLPKSRWDELRRATYSRVGYRCEICGGKGSQHPVECHEKWQYDDKNHVMKLVGLEGLCPSCHECKHIGLAQVRGNLGRAKRHLGKVNQIGIGEVSTLILEAFEQWAARSRHDWTVDISWAEEAK